MISILKIQSNQSLKVPICSLISQHFHHSTRLNKSLPNEDYQLIQKSHVNSMHFQKSLLRLPIPDLKKTCERYLRSQKAIQSADQYDETLKIVQEFENGVGIQLQEGLKAHDKKNKHTSYISVPWFDMYLRDRVPVVLNYNPFFAFHPDERPGFNDPLIRTTNILISSMRFMQSLRHELLEPEVFHLNAKKSNTSFFRNVTKWTPSALAAYAAMLFKAFPLDMSQFNSLFNTTRIPQKTIDRLARFPDAKHILFMKKGNFYVFDLFDKDGNLYPPDHIHACVSYIYNDESPKAEHPIGVLTSTNRDLWAEMRDELIAAGNEEALTLIDSAAFNICLDDVVTKIPPGEEDKAGLGHDPYKIYRTFLYGDTTNRWFDKSFSLIITSDGMAGINFEHSWGDGVAVMRYFNEVATDIPKNSYIHPDSKPSNTDASQYVRKLTIKSTPKVNSVINESISQFNKKTDSLDVNYFDTGAIHRGICKQHKLSADAVMQLSFQVAFSLQHGHQVATYESCSTSAFKHGRTETLRPATLETTEFANTVSLSKEKWPSKSELKSLLIKCSNVHSNLTKEAAMGQGFDRHLFGLKVTAEREGLPIPSLYQHPSYANINYNILSTSTLPSNLIVLGGFAPILKDGYGVGYRIEDQKCGLVVSSFAGERNGAEFIDCAERALNIIHDVLS